MADHVHNGCAFVPTITFPQQVQLITRHADLELLNRPLGTDPAEDLPIAGRGECFPGQAAKT
eukprot:361255-Chlamydomonas_euryale.AAC.1